MVEGSPERDAPDQQQQPVLDGDEEEDIDQLLAAANNSGPVRSKLSRLKRAAGMIHSPPGKRRKSTVSQSLKSALEEHNTLAHSGADSLETALSNDGSPSQSSSQSMPTSNKKSGRSAKDGENKADNEDYWDEEDEMQEYIMKRDLGQIEEDTSEDRSSSDESVSRAPDDNNDESEEDSPQDEKELNAETQRILRDTAKNDRIGKGAAPQIQPFSNVLEKIMKREGGCGLQDKVATKDPPSAKQLQTGERVNSTPPDLEDDDGDLVLVDSDEEDAGRKLFVSTQDQSQLFGADSQSLPIAPSASQQADPPRPPPSQSKHRMGLFSFMHQRPLEDTQDMIGSEPTRPQPVSTDAKDAGPMIGTDMPALHLGFGTDTLPEPTLPVLDAPQPEEVQPQHLAPAEASERADVASHDSGDEGEDEEDPEGSASEGGDEDEESILSSSSSSDDESEEDEGSESRRTPDSAAKRRALEEARALLIDRPKAKDKSAYFEDEAEESEDGEHSNDDDDDDDEDDGRDGILEDLIGHEQEGRHDEKRRAALHAAWLEQQDNAQVEQLLHGVKNGFRKRRNALDDEGGTNYDAALRRAALMNADEESDEGDKKEDDSSGEDEDAQSQQTDPFDNIEALSDEEAKEDLKQAQHLKLLEDSQKEEAGAVTLLDDDSRAVLGLLQKGVTSTAPAPARPPTGQPSQTNFASDLTNRPVKASFLGRKSSNPVSLLSKSSSQLGNNRSFVFGCENSNSGQVNAEELPEKGDDAGQTLPAAAPTSFAGLTLARTTVRRKGTKATASQSHLLGMLHSKMPSASHVADDSAVFDAVLYAKSIMSGRKRQDRR